MAVLRRLTRRAGGATRAARPPVAHALLIGLTVGPGWIAPVRATAQTDSTIVLRASLRTWEQRTRLAIFHRRGGFAGRTSERGIFQRFHPAMDSEYDLDLVSSQFPLAEDYEWHHRDNGIRGWAGSIDHRQLVLDAELAVAVPLGGGWTADARIYQQETLRAQRQLLWLGFRRELLDGRAHAFLRGTLLAEKPETDLELGFVWRPGAAELTVAVAALDVFSDLIYQVLEVDPGVADTVFDYRAHPFTGRLALDWPVGDGIRIEFFGLVLSPTRIAAASQTDRDAGFVQDERFGYAGGLLEWSPDPTMTIGGFSIWRRARSERRPLGIGDPSDRFDLTEEGWQLGIYSLHRLGRHLVAETWAARLWRGETRAAANAPPLELDYEDRTWAIRGSIAYRPAKGLQAELGLDSTLRESRGSLAVPTREPLERDHYRLRGDLGWRLAGRASFILGANADLDDGGFDGAHGRFVLFW